MNDDAILPDDITVKHLTVPSTDAEWLRQQSVAYAKRFSVRHEAVDATLGGILGDEPDTQRRMVRGIAHYFIDDLEVSQDQFEREWAAQPAAEAAQP